MNGLTIALIGGGALLLIVIIGVILYFTVFRKDDSTPTTTPRTTTTTSPTTTSSPSGSGGNTSPSPTTTTTPSPTTTTTPSPTTPRPESDLTLCVHGGSGAISRHGISFGACVHPPRSGWSGGNVQNLSGLFSTNVEGAKKYCVIEGLRNYGIYARVYKHQGNCEEKIISGETIVGEFYAYDTVKPGYFKYCILNGTGDDRTMHISPQESGDCPQGAEGQFFSTTTPIGY
jgi:hypothetical protein